MGRKPGTWVTTKGYSVLNPYKETVVNRILVGESIPKLAEEYNTTHTNMHRWLKAETDLYHRRVECVLIECDKTFPYKPGRLACSRLHIKRYNARGNKPGEYVECALPECKKLVLSPKNKWCCKRHTETHYHRVKRDYYKRMQLQTPSCEVCGEWRVLDEHHIEHEKGKSNKEGPTVYLCPTHHLAMHRGFAIYDSEEGFQWQDETILEGLKQKHPELIVK